MKFIDVRRVRRRDLDSIYLQVQKMEVIYVKLRYESLMQLLRDKIRKNMYEILQRVRFFDEIFRQKFFLSFLWNDRKIQT